MKAPTATEACCLLADALDAHDAPAIRAATEACQTIALNARKAQLRKIENALETAVHACEDSEKTQVTSERIPGSIADYLERQDAEIAEAEEY